MSGHRHSGLDLIAQVTRIWFDWRGARLEPVGGEVEEAPVAPIAGRQEEDQEQERAIKARPVEEVGADEEEEYECGRGICRYK